jgi:acyl-CoA thioester hydrolase
MSVEKYNIKIAVTDQDIDELGHVNNIIYLRWVQDAAVAHWKAAATEEQQNSILWVIKRHEIDYKHSARMGDEITAVTWVGEAQELIFERHTEIIRGSDEKLLARALTLWVPINRNTGRPARVDEELRKRFSTEKNEY